MEKKQKKLAHNAIIYSFFTLLQRGLGFFLLPVYTTFLTTDQLGIISTSSAVIAFITIIIGLSLRGSTSYYYYKYKEENLPYLKKIYGNNVSLILLFSIFCILLLLATKHWILDYLFLNIDFSPYVLLSLASIFLQPIYFFYQSVLKAKLQAKKAAGLDFVYFSIMIGLTLILILGFDFNAEGALLANSIASLTVFLISLFGLRKEITLSLNKAIIKKSLKYSLPILPHNLSGWAMNMVDKIMLNSMGSLSIVALFDVGSQIGKVVNMISLGINSAYSPWFFDQIKNDKNSHVNIVKVTNKIILLYAIIAVCVSWFSPELLFFISKPEYHDSWKIVPFIATAFVINGFYFTFSNVFFLEKTKYLPILSIIGALFNIGLNMFFIPKYGIMGAAIASLLTKLIFTVITFSVSQRLHFIPYKLMIVNVTIFIGFLLACLPFLFQDKLAEFNIWSIILIKSTILGVLIIPIASYNKGLILKIIKRRTQ